MSWHRYSKITARFSFLFLIGFAQCIACAGQMQHLCASIKKEAAPSAYLLDKDGKVSDGPVDFGVYRYFYEAADLILIPTTYRIVISPKRIGVGDAGIPGSIYLKETNPVCPNSKTYTVRYAMKGFPLYLPEQLPWKVKLKAARFPEIQDPLYKLFTADDLNIHFDAGVVGEVVDGKKIGKIEGKEE